MFERRNLDIRRDCGFLMTRVMILDILSAIASTRPPTLEAMAQVMIKTRRLADDEHRWDYQEVTKIPFEAEAQEAQLLEIIRGRYPDARPKSFYEGVASYVSSGARLLIIARYVDLERKQGSRDHGPEPTEQLFAA